MLNLIHIKYYVNSNGRFKDNAYILRLISVKRHNIQAFFNYMMKLNQITHFLQIMDWLLRLHGEIHCLREYKFVL